MPTPRINKILFGLYVLVAVAVFVGSFISSPLRAVAYAPLRDVLMPPPEPIVLSVLYSTEKAAWLDEVVPRFENEGFTYEGRPIEIELSKMGSREIYLAVLDGDATPVMISPASMLQISILEDLSANKFGAPMVSSTNARTCRPVLETPLVIVAWRDRAQALWGDSPNGNMWRRMQEVLTHPEGWGAHGHPEWGYIKFGHTDPLKSNSGFQTILLMTYNYFGKTSGLTSGDILGNDDFQRWFLEFEGAISNFGDSTGTYMQEIVAYGPSQYDFVSVYEATAIEHVENAVGRYGELQIYYPPTTLLSDHPFCLLDAEWVTPEEAAAAEIFLDYLTSREVQELALVKYGFRPVDGSIDLNLPGSPYKLYADNGLRTELPVEVDVPPGNVLNTLLDFWSRNVQR